MSVAEQACPFISGFEMAHTRINNHTATPLNDFKSLYVLILYLRIPDSCIEAILLVFEYARTLLLFEHCQIDIMQSSIQKIVFLDLNSDVHVTFYVLMCYFFLFVAIIPSLK